MAETQVAVAKVGTSLSAGGVNLRAAGIFAAVRSRWGAMPEQRRTWTIGGMALIAAVVAGMLWFAARPDWRTLFSGLDAKDTQQVTQELAAAGIPFQMTTDGTGIQVSAEFLDKARMEVAAKGMPQSGRLGFELFDKPNWVGSEFDERVNYQRALEGELEHTIETLGVVRSARVHLALPQASLFVQDQKPAKASVVLKLKRPSLPQEQADSIRNLVAGAVENLTPDQVSLVDADGRANLQARGRSAAEADAEQALEAKLVAMLEPLAGQGNVRASVNLAYDEGTEEHTDEVYDPTQSAMISVQKSERTSSGAGAKPAGVPGTASNSPTASPAGAVAGSTKAAAPGTPPLLQKPDQPVYPQAGGGPGQSQVEKQENGTYAVTRHVVHTEAAVGRLRRVTAAVVVNDRQVVDPATKLTGWKPRSPEEMHRLEGLAQAAVGFEEKRGDEVVMQNVSFSSNMPEVKLPVLQRITEGAKGILQAPPGFYRTGMVGLLGLVLVFVVLRPLATQVIATLKEPVMLGAGHGGSSSGHGGGGHGGLASGSGGGALGEGSAGGGQDWSAAGGEQRGQESQMLSRSQPRDPLYRDLAEHIRRDPVQSTRVLESWIGEAGPGEV